MKNIFRILSVALLPLLALVLGWELGVNYELKQLVAERQKLNELLVPSTSSGQVVKGDPEKEVDLSLIWSVWRLLDRHYIAPRDLKINALVYGAVGGLVQAVGDPYTVFMTPQDSKTFQDALSGTLEGIGAQLDVREGKIVVVAPLKGSPAEKAGLLTHDIIFRVDDLAVEGMRLEDVVAKIRGQKGTSVRLTVLREGKRDPVTITVVRESIHIPSVESKVIKTQSGSIGYVVLNQFGDASIAEIKKAFAGFPVKELKGVVLDLRFNGGGYLDGAEELVSMFVKEGKVVSVVRRDSPSEEHTVRGTPILPDTPMAVLINGGSASASEITAGALQDLRRAKIIGTKSFGKGTVQEVIDLPGGSSLRVTTAKWITPAGHDIAKKGITPDIIVDRTAEEYRAGKDPQLAAALEWLLDHEDVTAGQPPLTGSELRPAGKKTATGSVK
ncbi:MAG: S41 family peptidase [Candidatus Peribacteraceae bacterium]